ncbi:melanocyte-stimulating hormone receptor-like [Acropora muricata]|uniref:melanocyte-stimulating hormone receptor-like n=1 Tax=Acropora muricata TaxID=159855 RepID=UPI0034E48981
MLSCQGQTGVKVLSHNYFIKLTSSTFRRHLAFSQDGDEFLYTGIKTMMNINEHGHFSTSDQLHWMIDQRPFFVFIVSLNIFLAFTTTLGNTLILIALHKVSSIHPPTKFLLRCLAMSDFCVGVIVQPLFVAFLLEIASGQRHILFLTFNTFSYTLCGFSLTTAAAISGDRLLALLLGFRYRHTVTLRRVRCLVVCLLLVVIAMSFMYSLSSWGIANSAGFVIIIIPLFLSVVSHGKIFLKLRQHQAQARRQRVGHEQARPANGGGIPMNIERYKKIVSTIAWVQLALVLCYFPMFIFFGLAMATNWHKRGSFFYVCATTVVYFNSTLNPILFCWKIREVRQAVKTTVKQIRCFLS